MWTFTFLVAPSPPLPTSLLRPSPERFFPLLPQSTLSFPKKSCIWSTPLFHILNVESFQPEKCIRLKTRIKTKSKTLPTSEKLLLWFPPPPPKPWNFISLSSLPVFTISYLISKLLKYNNSSVFDWYQLTRCKCYTQIDKNTSGNERPMRNFKRWRLIIIS